MVVALGSSNDKVYAVYYTGDLYVTHATAGGKTGYTTSPTSGLTVDGVTFYTYSNTSYKASVAGTWYAMQDFTAASGNTVVTHATANQQVTITTGAASVATCFIID